MMNITLSVDEHLIEAARERARAEHTTLDDLFRRWLEDYIYRHKQVEKALAVIHDTQQYARTAGRKFTREEMNER